MVCAAFYVMEAPLSLRLPQLVGQSICSFTRYVLSDLGFLASSAVTLPLVPAGLAVTLATLGTVPAPEAARYRPTMSVDTA